VIRGERTDIEIGQHLVFYRGDYFATLEPYKPYECRRCGDRTMLAHFEVTPHCIPRAA
jgi:hypothetical protein